MDISIRESFVMMMLNGPIQLTIFFYFTTVYWLGSAWKKSYSLYCLVSLEGELFSKDIIFPVLYVSIDLNPALTGVMNYVKGLPNARNQ